MHTVKVWDLPVRLFHWSLVAAFAVAFISGENEAAIHEYAGYTVLGLVVFRIVYGFIGTQYARFGNFIYSPREVFTYLRSLLNGKPQHYLGHNPAGGWMVIALLLTLLIAGVSGWQHEREHELEHARQHAVAGAAATVDDEHTSRNAADINSHPQGHEESAWEEVHEVSVHVALILAIVHFLGVVASSYLHKEALVKAMITGFKKR